MFDKIKPIAPNIIYINGNGENVPPPVNADTANMVFVEAGGYVVGFTTLSEEERAAVLGLLSQQEITFDRPLRAPSITVDDIFVESRDIKDDPDEAFAEAIAEAKKGKGKDNAKSLDLIARSMLKKMEQLEKRVKDLEKKK